jgi:uncharacterized membrane protein
VIIWNRDIHLHSMAAHFTNALYPVATLFMFLFLFFKDESYLQTHYYILLLATSSVPFSYLTGVLDWRQRYHGAWVRIFVSKLRLGVALVITGVCSILLHQIFPQVLSANGIPRTIYIVLNTATIPIVAYLGYLGGRLVFGGAH